MIKKRKLWLLTAVMIIAALSLFACAPAETLVPAEAPPEPTEAEAPPAEVEPTEAPPPEEEPTEPPPLLKKPASQFLFRIIQLNSMDTALVQALKRQSVRWLCFL